MTVRVWVATAQKAGLDPEENEDQAAWRQVDDRRWRLAVADGATEATFSRQWASALVSAWVSEPLLKRPDAALLERARLEWAASIPAAAGMPWYAQAKLAVGSAATAAFVEVRSTSRAWRWSADVVGDCGVIVLQASGRRFRRRAIPFTQSAQFGSAPRLLSTEPGFRSAREVTRYTGIATKPFEAWIMSDALTQACLLADERRLPIYDRLFNAAADAGTFEGVVGDLRETRQLRNDDATLVCLQVSGEPADA